MKKTTRRGVIAASALALGAAAAISAALPASAATGTHHISSVHTLVRGATENVVHAIAYETPSSRTLNAITMTISAPDGLTFVNEHNAYARDDQGVGTGSCTITSPKTLSCNYAGPYTFPSNSQNDVATWLKFGYDVKVDPAAAIGDYNIYWSGSIEWADGAREDVFDSKAQLIHVLDTPIVDTPIIAPAVAGAAALAAAGVFGAGFLVRRRAKTSSE